MIRFIPDYSIVKLPGQKQSTELMSQQLTKESEHIFCEHHPSYENQVLFALGNGTLGVKIADVCCSDFKQKLEEHFKESLYT